MGLGGSKHLHEEGDRVLIAGRPNYDRVDNEVITSRYTLLNFLPLAILQQFRKFANMYFLLVGCIMAVGYYSEAFESAISPFTTLGPLAFVVSVSLLVEGSADVKRHKSDMETNNAPCIILRRADELDSDEDAYREKSVLNGKDVLVNLTKSYFQTSTASNPATPVGARSGLVGVGFQKIERKDIRQGHLVLVKNREMVPSDMILLASSGDSGSAYVETSSIDGETNLKLRTSPHLPKKLLKHLRDGTPMEDIPEEMEDDSPGEIESLEQATKRITRFSTLAYPGGISALENPNYNRGEESPKPMKSSRKTLHDRIQSVKDMVEDLRDAPDHTDVASGEGHYVAALTSEPPNPHVNTFSGKLTLPPVEKDGSCIDIPLGADNILLRGAVLRNTEWAIGLSCFTGTDTKLIQNSFETPSKFSKLDILINWTVVAIIGIMILCISYLATQAVISNDDKFEELWYIGLKKNTTETWPYLQDLESPEWETSTPNWLQMFFLYVTLLSNFVPLSMYVTVEAINFFSLYLIYVDLQLYDAVTDTRGLARSTNVSDLGQIEYIFSDKTGTLTQNVMRFKRCSVDGMIFGAPIAKSRPGEDEQEAPPPTSFHPLRQLLVGRTATESGQSDELDPLASYSTKESETDSDQASGFIKVEDGHLTFNAEMFLRVLCLCHTVVVEKDLDLSDNIDAKSVSSAASSLSGAKNFAKKLFGKGSTAGPRNRTSSDGSNLLASPLGAVIEGVEVQDDSENGARVRIHSTGSLNTIAAARPFDKSPDGAPAGFAYQAESPDEGALVSAASLNFGFQVIDRDSNGIKIRSAHPSLLSDMKITEGLKSGQLSAKRLAAESAAGKSPVESSQSEVTGAITDPSNQRVETWSILAVNKFDSERKRMSILLRSPPELGGFPILLCKGADSAMLDAEVCTGAETLVGGDGVNETSVPKALDAVAETMAGEDYDAEDQWELAQMLGIQSHLGDFASEGLRTLVLGVRILSEKECSNWLEMYKEAATSIKNRDEKLKAAAFVIEKHIHIVGATAIEDKLQVGVPKTISQLEKAGIKLWVLTGDKRETAIEIGYSTQVLTPKMHLTEVADKGADHVRTQCAMEFMRLIKSGKLQDYQMASLDVDEGGLSKENFMFAFGKLIRKIGRFFSRISLFLQRILGNILGVDDEVFVLKKKALEKQEADDLNLLKDTERRRMVRKRAENIIKDYLDSEEGQKHRRAPKAASAEHHDDDGSDNLSLTSDELPAVFNRASSARELLDLNKSAGNLSTAEMRSLQIANLTAQQQGDGEDPPLVDEDTLSLNSFMPDASAATSDFDKKRRTLLERMFAVDHDVRRGRLVKHLVKSKRDEALGKIARSPDEGKPAVTSEAGPRALVIEGAALKHLLGDPELEEIIFAVANVCSSVIACRVSPRQKALLVNLVRHNVVPEPTTLAIGDGANDVGMIQEAHVGVGISGKEGKQAVNASDFAIAQFRFLEPLILVHGRWDFLRLSTVVLFSFYKNAMMAGCLIVYNGETIYSGTPLFDQWSIAMLNFVSGIPILFLGLFDRCLEKDYVRRNPQVYSATRNNELLTRRTLIRWIVMTFSHVFVLYYASVPQLSDGGGVTSAFDGLMRDAEQDNIGDGEGGDLQSVGTVTYTCLVLLLAYKVLYESKSIINGRWPAFTCRKDIKEGFFSRLGYTWIGITYFSIFFWFLFIFIYHIIGERRGPGTFFQFVGITPRVLGARTINWLIILFNPVFGMSFDVAGKVFSNMYYPTQTQIHMEIENKEKAEAKKAAREGRRSPEAQRRTRTESA